MSSFHPYVKLEIAFKLKICNLNLTQQIFSDYEKEMPLSSFQFMTSFPSAQGDFRAMYQNKFSNSNNTLHSYSTCHKQVK